MEGQMSLWNTPPTRLGIVRLLSNHSCYARSQHYILPTVKAYGELPENAKINETDAFGEEDGEYTFEFGDEGEMDIDDI